MTLNPRLRAAFLLCGLLLAGGAISAPSQGQSCPPCDPDACYAGCMGAGACIYNRVLRCEICTCAP
jgi:hypothetical protein